MILQSKKKAVVKRRSAGLQGWKWITVHQIVLILLQMAKQIKIAFLVEF